MKEITSCKDNPAVSVFKTDAACHRNIDGIAVARVARLSGRGNPTRTNGISDCVLTREARIYMQACAALERLAAGRFGSCLHCDEPISDHGLQALPRAALCLTCQEDADNAPNEVRPSDLAVVGCSLTRRVVCQ